MLIYSKVAFTLWLQTQFGMIFYPLEIKIQYYQHIWTVFISKNLYQIFIFAKLSSSLLFAYVMGHKRCTIIWKLIWKKFFSQISSGNLKFPQKSILARLTTFYGQRLNIITFQWPGTIFDMWEPIPKHFYLYLRICLLEIQTSSQGMTKENLINFLSTFLPKTS